MSTPRPPATPSPRRDKPANRWHRSAGITAVGVLVYLLVTGVPLQFSAELGLGTQHVRAPWVLDWYGLQAPHTGTRSGPAAQLGTRLYVNGQAGFDMGPLKGVVSAGEFLVVADRASVMVLHPDDPSTVETTRLATTINGLGVHDNRPYLDTASGILAADDALLNWQAVSQVPTDIEWAAVIALPAAEVEPLRQQFRQTMLTTERWLQDLHSGRFFGTPGVLIIDLASALMLVLAGTGLVLWWRSRRS